MVSLGFWQLARRAARLQRNAYIAERLARPPVPIAGRVDDPAAVAYRHVTVAGSFDFADELVLRNRALNGRPGVHVLTPLRIAGTDAAVLVDRGWIPYEQSAPEDRRRYQGEPIAAIRGVARPEEQRPSRFAPADPVPAPGQSRLDTWFRVDVARIQRQVPYRLLPVYVVADPEPGSSGLPRRVDDLMLDEGPHLSYAVQWFSFAVILVAGYVVRAARTT